MICAHCGRGILAEPVRAECGGDCCSTTCARALDLDYVIDTTERFDQDWRGWNVFARQNGGRD